MKGTTTLKDKLVFFLGVNTGFVNDGLPDNRYLEFYRKRCSPDLHSAILGNVVIPEGFGSNKTTPILSSHKIWIEVANAIRSEGTVPGIQLATAWPGYIGQRRFLAKDTSVFIQQARNIIQNLHRDEIDSVLEGFLTGAALAVDHGYGHVQIHAAHGYLPNLLINEDINPEASYVLERFSEIALWLKKQSIETSIRCSIRTGNADFDNRNLVSSFRKIVDLPFDFVDLSSGYYNIDKRLIYPAIPTFLNQRYQDSMNIAEHYPNCQFIISGKIFDQLNDLPENVDLGVCRDLIANPSFLSDLSNGCRNHGKCHFHSRGQNYLTCSRW